MTSSGSRVVLITGAGGGLGQALVAEFAAQGWRVVAAAHRQAPALPSPEPECARPRAQQAQKTPTTESAANVSRAWHVAAPGDGRAPNRSPRSMAGERVQKEQGAFQEPAQENPIWPVQLDVTNSRQTAEVLDQTLQRWQRLDVLVNNAGAISDHALWQMKCEDWDSVLSVNLKGAFLCAQAAARVMARQREGQIISIGSHSGRAGARGQANYAAAKAGLIGLTTSLARELGSRNVRANVVLPGVLRTAMTAPLAPEQLQALAEANALGRLNAVAEVARFVVFLAGLQNVSGQIFQLDSRIARWT